MRRVEMSNKKKSGKKRQDRDREKTEKMSKSLSIIY